MPNENKSGPKTYPSASAETLEDVSKLSRPIYKHVRLAIMDALMAFADLEAAIEEFIWAYVEIQPRYGKLLTGLDINKKIGIARALAKEEIGPREFKESTGNIWSSLNDMREDRNNLVHGSLYMYERSMIACVSLRDQSVQTSMKVHLIHPEKLDLFTLSANSLVKMFYDLKENRSRKSTGGADTGE